MDMQSLSNDIKLLSEIYDRNMERANEVRKEIDSAKCKKQKSLISYKWKEFLLVEDYLNNANKIYKKINGSLAVSLKEGITSASQQKQMKFGKISSGRYLKQDR